MPGLTSTPFVTTYGALPRQFLPSYTSDPSTSTSTANYSDNHPSPSPPCYSLPDPRLINKGIERFTTFLNETGHQDTEIPEAVKSVWLTLETALQFRSPGENWVTKIGCRIIDMLDLLFRGIDDTMLVSQQEPPRAHSQQGDVDIVLRRELVPVMAVAGEWKTTTVLQAHQRDLSNPLILPSGILSGAYAMSKKLGLHMTTTAASYNLNCKYGIFFTSDFCIIAERLAAEVPGYLTAPGIALSHMHPVRDTGVPIFAVLMGLLLLKEDGLRNPWSDPDLMGSFSDLMPELQRLELLKPDANHVASPLGLPSLPPFGDGSHFSPFGDSTYTSNAGAATSPGNGSYGSAGAAGGTSAQYNFNHLLLYFDLPGLRTVPRQMMRISRETLTERCSSPAPSSAGSSPSVSALSSTPPTSPELGKPSSLPSSAIPRSVLCHRPGVLFLEGTVACGDIGTVHRGNVQIDQHKPFRIILKSYGNSHFPELIHELDVYAALNHLAVVIPQLYAVIGPPTGDYASLLLEDAGERIVGDTWEHAALTITDKRRLYYALAEIHAAGVVHGDVFPRNVVRRPRGALCFIDFGAATLGHRCPGPTCRELFSLQRDLAFGCFF
ncbi:hypothetical protein C8J57DRAFT_1344243 [Mycena rebaudengoi]|nr:hypothetical protein C8J57DRAFT_1344243 [Mycena rebaudengoi]